MIEVKNRILMKDGTSVVTEEKAIEFLLESGTLPPYIKVIQSDDSNKFKEKYNMDIAFTEEANISPKIIINDKEYVALISELMSKYRDDTPEEKHLERIGDELEFFSHKDRKHIIIKLYHLVNTFKRDEIVWGVGRGSSCASYIFYLLEVHDINPIKFGIDFKEFSKEE